MLVENVVEVAAAPSVVWAALTDTARLSEWNPRLRRVEGVFSSRSVVTLHYAKTNPLIPARFVVDVDVCLPGRHLEWSGPRNVGRHAIRASHWFHLDERAGGTRVTHGERFAGPVARLLWPLLRPVVAANHADVNAALARRCGGAA